MHPLCTHVTRPSTSHMQCNAALAAAYVPLPLLLCVCCSQADIAAAKPAAAAAAGADGSKLTWDTPKEDEDISTMLQHAKVCSRFQPFAACTACAEHVQDVHQTMDSSLHDMQTMYGRSL